MIRGSAIVIHIHATSMRYIDDLFTFGNQIDWLYIVKQINLLIYVNYM